MNGGANGEGERVILGGDGWWGVNRTSGGHRGSAGEMSVGEPGGGCECTGVVLGVYWGGVLALGVCVN